MGNSFIALCYHAVTSIDDGDKSMAGLPQFGILPDVFSLINCDRTKISRYRSAKIDETWPAGHECAQDGGDGEREEGDPQLVVNRTSVRASSTPLPELTSARGIVDSDVITVSQVVPAAVDMARMGSAKTSRRAASLRHSFTPLCKVRR